jgi:hypothetical protein
VIDGERWIDFERQVGQDAPDEEPGADSWPDEHGVLADPAEPGSLGEFPLLDRPVSR